MRVMSVVSIDSSISDVLFAADFRRFLASMLVLGNNTTILVIFINQIVDAIVFVLMTV